MPAGFMPFSLGVHTLTTPIVTYDFDVAVVKGCAEKNDRFEGSVCWNLNTTGKSFSVGSILYNGQTTVNGIAVSNGKIKPELEFDYTMVISVAIDTTLKDDLFKKAAFFGRAQYNSKFPREMFLGNLLVSDRKNGPFCIVSRGGSETFVDSSTSAESFNVNGVMSKLLVTTEMFSYLTGIDENILNEIWYSNFNSLPME